jgi:hypothetical protein
MAYKEKLERVSGDTWDIDLTITQTIDGVTTPMTGLTTAGITATIKHRDTGAQIWQGTRAAGQITVTDDPAGEITIRVPAATTAPLGERLYNADIEVTSGATVVTPKRFYISALEGYS